MKSPNCRNWYRITPRAGADIGRDRGGNPRAAADFAPARRERELEAAAQVEFAQPRRLRDRQALIVDEIAILRVLARLREVEAADDARARREGEIHVDADGRRVEILALDGQLSLDEAEAGRCRRWQTPSRCENRPCRWGCRRENRGRAGRRPGRGRARAAQEPERWPGDSGASSDLLVGACSNIARTAPTGRRPNSLDLQRIAAVPARRRRRPLW